MTTAPDHDDAKRGSTTEIDLGSPEAAAAESSRARSTAARDVEAAMTPAPKRAAPKRATTPASAAPSAPAASPASVAPSSGLAGDATQNGKAATPAQNGVRLDDLAHVADGATLRNASAAGDQKGTHDGIAERATDDLREQAAEAAVGTAGRDEADDAGSEVDAAGAGGGSLRAPDREAGEAGVEVAAAEGAGRGGAVAGAGRGEAGEAGGGVDAGRGGLLAGVLVGEPPVGDGVAAVYRRAEKMRRRRVRKIVAAGMVSAAVVAGFGYALATAAIPTPYQMRRQATPVVGPAPVVDPLLVALQPVLRDNGLKAVPREPGAGPGWRQYAVAHATTGRPRGLVEVAVYAAPDGLCFPLRNDREACARPMGDGGMEYARYSDDRDVDWQVHEAIARRVSDGRVIAVMATGERGTGRRADGRPPLSAAQVAGVAVDVRVMSAFDPNEDCTGPDAACPVLKVPVPKAR